MPTGRLKIVHCIGSLGVGGAERQLTELINRLPSDQFEQSLVLFRREGAFLDQLRQSDCEVIALLPQPAVQPKRFRGFQRTPIGFAKFVQHLRRTKPDVLHAQLSMANIVAFAAGRTARVPAVVTSQLNLCRDPHAETRMQRTENRVLRSSTAVFANSRAVEDDLVELQGVDPSRIWMVYNGVDLERFAPRTIEQQRVDRRAAGFDPHDRVIACVANLHRYKGHVDLIAAFARLQPKNENLKLMLIGRDAGAMATARALADEHGVSDSVRFMGQISAVEDLLSFAEFVVHPSHEEGFANAILEAMSAGKPVVATEVGGNGEAIVNGRTGLLVPARDPASLETAMTTLLDDVDRSGAMGRAARMHAHAHYGIDRMVDEFGAWYRELAAST